MNNKIKTGLIIILVSNILSFFLSIPAEDRTQELNSFLKMKKTHSYIDLVF